MRDAAAPARAFRIGIDVGGTFTKAVLIDNATHAVVGRYSVKTTHDHPRGVAAGVVEVFRNVLAGSDVTAGEVVFLAHSTTQATNALLEGDVAKVGIVGTSGRPAAKLAEAQVHIDAIELAPGRMLETANRFLVSDEADHAALTDAVEHLAAEGADVIVASCAFGVDDTGIEEQIRDIADGLGLLTTCGHEITRLYGLTTRTRTAVINASILPRMHATAEMTEASVREAGITAPLMIMRGDGGVMDIREMRRRPATTMLSGPAASVAGALMHLRISDGLYFEVGGTSTNIGVIRDGRPTITHARVGGHETYVSSLDVRVLGVAGGSMVRARPSELIDIGPRSAHIAGLPYAAFADPADLVGAIVEPFETRQADGQDYIALRTPGGAQYAITTTCAANALGFAKPGMHAYGEPKAARAAFEALAAYLGATADEAARAVLTCAADKVIPVVEELVREYRLDPDQRILVGEGGGAGALVPFVAASTGYPFEISRDAEVISSIGVALALVRDVVERIIPHPKPEDLQAIREEARLAAVRLGAHPRAVDVTVEVDRQTHLVRATAMGSAEMQSRDPSGAIHEQTARRLAAEAMDSQPSAVELAASTGGYRAYRIGGEALGRVRVLDDEGTVRLRRNRAVVLQSARNEATGVLRRLWQDLGDGGSGAAREVFLFAGRHFTDLSSLEDVDQAVALAEVALADDTDASDDVILVGVPADAAKGS
jgi:N-methylhydantoinase A